MPPDVSGAHRWRRSGGAAAVGAVLLAAGAVLCVWESGLYRSSRGAHRSVALLIATAFLAALVLGRGRQRQTSRTWATRTVRGIRRWRTKPGPMVVAAVVWSVLVAATVGWDLVSFVVQSHTLPTLSYFIGRVTRYRVGKGVVFALWLSLGGYLAAGWRTEAPR